MSPVALAVPNADVHCFGAITRWCRSLVVHAAVLVAVLNLTPSGVVGVAL